MKGQTKLRAHIQAYKQTHVSQKSRFGGRESWNWRENVQDSWNGGKFVPAKTADETESIHCINLGAVNIRSVLQDPPPAPLFFVGFLVAL